MSRPIAVALLLALNACAQQMPVLYIGRLQPLAGTCDPATRAQLTLHGTAILFTPASGTLILRGRRTGTSLMATEALTGSDRKSYILAFQGEIRGDDIEATYQTPRCRYGVTLHAASD